MFSDSPETSIPPETKPFLVVIDSAVPEVFNVLRFTTYLNETVLGVSTRVTLITETITGLITSGW